MTSTSPEKPAEAMPRGLVLTIVGVVTVTALYGIVQRATDLWVAKVDVPIVGEWRAEGRPWRIVFRPDKTVDLDASDPAQSNAVDARLLGPGVYWLGSGGKVAVKMKTGKIYTVEWKALSPNRFDLIDAETEGVTTFDKAPDAAAPK